MSDVIERELREAFAARVETVVPRIVDRLSAVDFQARRMRVRLATRIGAVGTVIAAGAIAAVLGLASGAPDAFAGWTAIPARVTGAGLSQAHRACGITRATRVLAAESRGPFVALVFVRGNQPWQCITRGSSLLMKETTQYPARLYEAVPASKITTPSLTEQPDTASAKRRIAKLQETEDRLFRKHDAGPRTYKIDDQIAAIRTGPDALISLTGTAAKNVTAVRFVLADGKTVSATVQGGWYEAWWPGSSKRGATNPVRVQITTSSGTQSTKMVDGALEKCRQTAGACGVFAPIALKHGIAPALRTHFAFFQNTAPTSVSSMPKILRRVATNPLQMQNAQAYGVGISQARVVKLPGGSVGLIMPGTEGLCVAFAHQNIVSSGCEDIQTVLRWGDFGGYGSSGPSGSTYWLEGLVPNGNKSVTVNMVSGAKLTVPVHDNFFYANFSATPRSITFKNAFGNEKRHPA